MDRLAVSLEILKLTTSSQDLENLSLEEKQKKTLESFEVIHNKVLELSNRSALIQNMQQNSVPIYLDRSQYGNLEENLIEASTNDSFELKTNVRYRIKDSRGNIEFSTQQDLELSPENYLGEYSSVEEALNIIRSLDKSNTGKFLRIKGIEQLMRATICYRTPSCGVGQPYPGVCGLHPAQCS